MRMSMEDSCSSYSFSDSSLDSSASCTCTKMTYSSSPSKSPAHNGHVQLGRSHSEPAIRTSDMIKAEEDRHGMEPKNEIFSIQLEPTRKTDSTDHSHVNDPFYVEALKVRAEIVASAEANRGQPQQILADKMVNQPVEVRVAAGTTETIKRHIRYKKAGLTPKNPEKLAEIPVPFPEDFCTNLIYDNELPRNRILVFASEDGLGLLESATTWFMDGTHSTALRVFEQVFAVRVPLGETSGTAAYALLPSKEQAAYEECLTAILDACLARDIRPTPSKVVCDYEVAIHNAVRRVMAHDIQIQVTFHLLEAEKRKLFVLQQELKGHISSANSTELKKQLEVEALEKSIEHIQVQYDQLEEEYRGAMASALRHKGGKPASRSQPAIGLKQTSKTRPTIFGTITEETKKEENKRLKNVVPQMQSLSQMFDKAGGGYDCPSTNCNENDALIFKDGNLVAGSTEALIQHLVPTTEYNPDRTYVFTFLLSSRLFIRPHELLSEVCQVCTFQQNLTGDNVQKKKLGKFGQNIIQLLSEWTEMFPYDFRDERMMKHLKDISQRIVVVFPELRQDMGGITHNLLNKLAQLNQYEDVLTKLNSEALKRSQTQIAPTTDIVEVCPGPLRFAQQLTHIELERLSQIGPEEFIQAFVKEELVNGKTVTVFKDMKKTRNLEAYVQWFNRLSYLVASEICSHLKKKNRVKLIEYFIDVAKECINIGNFNSCMSIIAGMNMNPVARLKKTWAKVNKQKFGILELQMDPSSNFGSYRSCLKAAMWRAQGATDSREKIVIPFFSLFVKDIYFLNEGCANRTESGHINFEKSWQLAKHISDFVTWQQVECPFEKRTDVLHYILTSPVFSETTLSLASYECEQPENSYDKERHKKLKSEAGL